MGGAKNWAMGDAMGFHQHKQPHSQKKTGGNFSPPVQSKPTIHYLLRTIRKLNG